jgi:hypothetical protein
VSSEQRRSIQATLQGLGRGVSENGIGLTLVSPSWSAARSYGDVVPAGILLRALRAYEPAGSSAVASLRAFLKEQQQGLLWPYHTGGLITSVDSGLVLLGFSDPHAVEALEEFRTDGGYLPQHCAEEPGRDVMAVSGRNRHWCQPDFSIGLLVAALRAENGLPAVIEPASLRDGFETRSGLYFANPYLVDWLLALALRGAPDHELTIRLAGEILSSMNADGSFGSYDPCLSTALAMLALSALGAPACALARSRQWLLSSRGDDGRWPGGTPFYSTVRIDESRLPGRVYLNLAFSRREGQLIREGDEFHAVSLYRDDHGLITTALAALALTVPEECAGLSVASLPLSSAHRRYRCADPVEYVASVALTPYVGKGHIGKPAVM